MNVLQTVLWQHRLLTGMLHLYTCRKHDLKKEQVAFTTEMADDICKLLKDYALWLAGPFATIVLSVAWQHGDMTFSSVRSCAQPSGRKRRQPRRRRKRKPKQLNDYAAITLMVLELCQMNEFQSNISYFYTHRNATSRVAVRRSFDTARVCTSRGGGFTLDSERVALERGGGSLNSFNLLIHPVT